jgi:hypothetical protein
VAAVVDDLEQVAVLARGTMVGAAVAVEVEVKLAPSASALARGHRASRKVAPSYVIAVSRMYQGSRSAPTRRCQRRQENRTV